MERLTDRLRMYIELYKQPPFGREVGGTAELLLEALDRITEYEDLEEQGLLLKLPCKVGDTVYYADNSFYFVVVPIKIESIIINNKTKQYNGVLLNSYGDIENEYEFDDDCFSKTIFLTEAEAESALERMEGENGLQYTYKS